MFCPNCKEQHATGKFCPNCGEPLVEDPQQQGTNSFSLNLGDANAINGNLVVNNTNVSNTYISEREKTTEEIEQEKRILFMNLCEKVFEDGIFEEHEVLQVENERQRLGLDKSTADNIINLAKQSAHSYRKELTARDSIFMKIVSQVIQKNDITQIKSLLPKLEAFTDIYRVDDVRFKYNLILAGLYPDKLISDYENEKSDNYWQTFWVFIAYLKKGKVGKAEKSASRLNLYKDYPESNELLLSSLSSSYEFGKDIATDYLAIIEAEPCSPDLRSFYEALMLELDPEKAKHYGLSSDYYSFYFDHIIHIDNPYNKAMVENEIRAEIDKEKEKKQIDEVYKLGFSYYYGKRGKKQDYSEAVKWFRIAAEQGHVEAQSFMGSCYYSGQGISQDYSEAVKWFRMAAEQGDSCAQCNLGNCYYFGQGVSQDYSEAVKWFRIAAEQGHVEAQFYVGNCYYIGEGVSQDYEEAVKWYRKAAEQGDAEACHMLGRCYYHGKGVSQDYGEAVKWIRNAAEQGLEEAQYDLGICYEYGQGISQDYSEAVKWYRRAAEQGHANAQCNLGYCYNDGQGVTQDYSEAVRWFRMAAENGDAVGQNNLGVRYYYGQGVSKDYTEAVKWWRMAAEQGDACAQSNLGECYYFGRGVPQDYDEARKWWRKAADQGYQDAVDYLNGKTPEP